MYFVRYPSLRVGLGCEITLLYHTMSPDLPNPKSCSHCTATTNHWHETLEVTYIIVEAKFSRLCGVKARNMWPQTSSVSQVELWEFSDSCLPGTSMVGEVQRGWPGRGEVWQWSSASLWSEAQESGASPNASNYQQNIPAYLVTSISCVLDCVPQHALLKLKCTWAPFGVPQIFSKIMFY